MSFPLTNHQVSLLDTIAAFARERCAGHDSAHDALHLTRVLANARSLMHAERSAGQAVDVFVVEAACWLHDLVQVPKGSGSPGEAALLSASSAREFLAGHAAEPAQIDAIVDAVAAHSYSGGRRPESIEAAIVQDADRLDALGAVGIARLWVTGVSLGGKLHDAVDPSGSNRALDDRAYGLDHIERKLLRLPETMNTEFGRREAVRRAEFVQRYRDEFLRELGFSQSGSQASLLEQLVGDGSIDADLIEPGVPTPTVPDAARALGVDERQIIKSLLFAATSGEVVLVILSGASRVSRQRLRDATGLRGLALADPAVVLERTGYPAGGTPPVGHTSRLNVIVDTGVMELRVAYGGGGRVDTLLRITPDEIVRVTNARVEQIAEHRD